MRFLVFLLMGSLILVNAQSSGKTEKAIAKNYWQGQPNNASVNHTLFFNALTEDVYFVNTFTSFVTAYGKAAVVALISGIGTPAAGFYVRGIQGVSTIWDPVARMVFSRANKTICGLGSGDCGVALTYGAEIQFNNESKIVWMREFVHPSVTTHILPEGFPDGNSANAVANLCGTINALCVGTSLSFSPRTCFQHWFGAPLFPGSRYTLSRTGKATTCAILAIGDIVSGAATPSEACPRLGPPVSGVEGCWNGGS